MDLAPRFEERLRRSKVYRLRKSLYGLKQSSRAWFEWFGNVVKRHDFWQSQADHTLFFKHSTKGKIVILIVYINDIIMIGVDLFEINKLKNKLETEFDIKDLGKLKYFSRWNLQGLRRESLSTNTNTFLIYSRKQGWHVVNP